MSILKFNYQYRGKVYSYTQDNIKLILNKLTKTNDNNSITITENIDGKPYQHTITLYDQSHYINETQDNPIILYPTVSDAISVPAYVHNINKDINPSDLTDIIAIDLGMEIVYNSLLLYKNGLISYITDEALKNTLLNYFTNINIIKYIGRQYYLFSNTHISKLNIKNYYRYDDAMTLIIILCGIDITRFGKYNTTIKLTEQQKIVILEALKKIYYGALYDLVNDLITKP